MQIRRVIETDGGNHKIGDEIQYRLKDGDAWQVVQEISSIDALIADVAEGIEPHPDWVAGFGEKRGKELDEEFRAEVERRRAEKEPKT